MYRDTDGFIDLDRLDNFNYDENRKVIRFTYNDEEYFYKERSKSGLYDMRIISELLAYEIGTYLNLDCVYYDIAKSNNKYGVISKSFLNKGDNIITMTNLLNKYEASSISLEEIWSKLNEKYNLDVVKTIMNNYVNIFLFDIIIGNGDRHTDNIMLIKNGDDIRTAPIFDNEYVTRSIGKNTYRLAASKEDLPKYKEDPGKDILYEFLRISDSIYIDRLEYFKEAIKDENILLFLNNIEKRINTNIPSQIKNELRNKFKENIKIIESTIEKLNSKTM